MTNSIAEVKENDVLFLIGTNTAENHPVIWYQMVRALKKGATLIVADPRETVPAQRAHHFLQLRPGTNIALINGLIHVVLAEGLHDASFVAAHTEGFDALEAAVARYTPQYVSQITGVPAETIAAAARAYAGGQSAGIYYAMGITQHTTGVDTVRSLSNLALICGNIGKENAGINPLRGQGNVQGACDMGALPDVLPGYQRMDNPASIERFATAWGVPLPSHPGIRASETADAVLEGRIRALYVMGENMMVSDPDVNHLEKALDRLDFLVVQDIFLSETAARAHVVLPAACHAEKEGTFTNTERRVQRLHKAVEPPGQARPDWEILRDIMVRMGHPADYSNPEDIMEEIRALTPQYGGIRYGRLDPMGLQWPCPHEDHPGTKFLHGSGIARGKGLLVAVEHAEAQELPDEEFPLVLTTGRVLYHYHTATMTGRVAGLRELSPHGFVEISPKTAASIEVADGDHVRIVSRRGAITAQARVTEHIMDGVVFIPFHFARANANVLTHAALDPVARIPELKVAAVRIEKLEGWLGD